jgi:hypothetical protein
MIAIPSDELTQIADFLFESVFDSGNIANCWELYPAPRTETDSDN